MPEPEESAARFHETVRRAHKRRLSAAIMRQLWQENHFVDGFLAEMGVNRGTSR